MLEPFIIKAKQNCYVGDGETAPSSRLLSHDLKFEEGQWKYLDSYFGATDFLGQETVWYNDEPVWAMNYYGRILRDDMFDAGQGAAIIRAALSSLYTEDRFLGGFEYIHDDYLYQDTSQGDFKSFTGYEIISKDNIELYRLDYHGGMIRE